MAKKSLNIPVLLGKKEEELTLPEAIFNIEASKQLLAQYVRVFLHNLKLVNAKTKTRSEVEGSTRKIYRQKGTGRARHGAKKAPIFVGGGTAHGPKNDTPLLTMPKKMRRMALFAALTLKLKDKSLHVMDDVALSQVDKTKDAVKLFEKVMPEHKKLMVVMPHEGPGKRFVKNTDMNAVEVGELNAYNVLNSKKVLFTKSSVGELLKHFKIKS